MSNRPASASYTTLAQQAFHGAAQATDEATRNALYAMGQRWEAKAAEARHTEAIEDQERRAFWQNQTTVTNWVS